ncbi:hypothetical protein Patl1_07054 [Pistacia atlantica]|uniref:Uncharacterized protein n=1 Tax=Pistacia atlantica TaxID=434234 RepID=A0ACC1ALD7_9ROSI|nr:hypothetical protein Patl1_07054 [Pistacia atlantica]
MIADTENLMKLYDEKSGGIESGTENGTSKEVEVVPNANTYCYLRAGCLLLFLIVLFGCWSLLMENLPFLRKILYFTFQLLCFNIIRNWEAFEDEVDDFGTAIFGVQLGAEGEVQVLFYYFYKLVSCKCHILII